MKYFLFAMLFCLIGAGATLFYFQRLPSQTDTTVPSQTPVTTSEKPFEKNRVIKARSSSKEPIIEITITPLTHYYYGTAIINQQWGYLGGESLNALSFTTQDGLTVGTLSLESPSSTTLKAEWTPKGSDKTQTQILSIDTSIPALLSAHVTESIHDIKQNERCSITASLVYPDTTELLGQKIHEQLELFYTHATSITLIKPLAQRASTYLSDCQEELNALYDEDETHMRYFSDQTAYPVLYTKELTSILFETSDYWGGAHPNSVTKALTLNLDTSKRVTLGDLIKQDSLQELYRRHYKKLLASEYADGIYEELKPQFEQKLIEPELPATEQALKLGSETQFYLTPGALVIYYNAYDIAPYAAGSTDIPLTYEEIKDLINPAGPLAKYLEGR